MDYGIEYVLPNGILRYKLYQMLNDKLNTNIKPKHMKLIRYDPNYLLFLDKNAGCLFYIRGPYLHLNYDVVKEFEKKINVFTGTAEGILRQRLKDNYSFIVYIRPLSSKSEERVQRNLPRYLQEIKHEFKEVDKIVLPDPLLVFKDRLHHTFIPFFKFPFQNIPSLVEVPIKEDNEKERKTFQKWKFYNTYKHMIFIELTNLFYGWCFPEKKEKEYISSKTLDGSHAIFISGSLPSYSMDIERIKNQLCMYKEKNPSTICIWGILEDIPFLKFILGEKDVCLHQEKEKIIIQHDSHELHILTHHTLLDFLFTHKEVNYKEEVLKLMNKKLFS